MDKQKFRIIECYMQSCMNDNDTAHGYQHVYRVLYNALEISKVYEVDIDVVVASALLHDIGRNTAHDNASTDHAYVGAVMAYDYLVSNDWTMDKAEHVKSCIISHSNRETNSIEGKILYDADKLDIIGAIGMARLIAHSGIDSLPLYSVDDDNMVLVGVADEADSFFKLYNTQFKNVYDRLFTSEAKEIARDKRNAGLDYVTNLYNEVKHIHKKGIDNLERLLK